MTFLKYRFHYISGMDWGNIGGGSDGEDYDKKTMSDDQAKKIIIGIICFIFIISVLSYIFS